MPRLQVDFIGCDGRGMCAEILPDLIRLDDWGYPIVADCEVSRELLPDAAEAVRICPMLALRLDHAGTGHKVVAASTRRRRGIDSDTRWGRRRSWCWLARCMPARRCETR